MDWQMPNKKGSIRIPVSMKTQEDRSHIASIEWLDLGPIIGVFFRREKQRNRGSMQLSEVVLFQQTSKSSSRNSYNLCLSVFYELPNLPPPCLTIRDTHLWLRCLLTYTLAQDICQLYKFSIALQ